MVWDVPTFECVIISRSGFRIGTRCTRAVSGCRFKVQGATLNFEQYGLQLDS